MATDSMAGPQNTNSLDEWASEACSDIDLNVHRAEDSRKAATPNPLSEAEAPQTTDGESDREGSSLADGSHSVPSSGTDSISPNEGFTGTDSTDGCVKSVGAEDKVSSEECPSTPLVGGGKPDEAELTPETQKVSELPVVPAEKIPEEIVGTEQQSTSRSEPEVPVAETPAYEKEGDSVDGGHTHINEPSPQQVSEVTTKETSAETKPELLDAPDSPVFLSEGGEDSQEDLSVDCKPLDFSSARDQWVRRDSSSSKPPTPAVSRTSSVSYTSDLPPGHAIKLAQAEEALSDPSVAIPAGVQQGEEMPHSPAVLQEENQEGQQVCKETPPMATVAGQSANLVAESPGPGPIVVKEPLTQAGGEGEGEVEAERESGQTSREREQMTGSVHTAQTQEEDGKAEGEASHSTETTHSRPATNASNAQLKACRMEDPYDDNQSDSGVSADFSAEVSTRTPLSNSPEPGKPPPNETPIEREIRLAAEREQSLRQARGLSSTDKAQEFVEIPMLRPILSQSLPSSKATKDKGKERQFAGKKMQREISQETQREQDLVQLGRVPGFYEKGTVRQLRERKLLFEAFQQPKETSTASTSGSQSKRTTTSVSASDLSTLGTLGDGSSASSTYGGSTERRYSLELLSNPRSSAPLACGPGLSEGLSSQVIIIEGHQASQMPSSESDWPPHPSPGPGLLTEAQPVTVVDSGITPVSLSSPGVMVGAPEEVEEVEEEVNSVMVRENPFFKLRPSMGLRPTVEQDIRQAQQRERELQKQRTSLYHGTSDQHGPLVPQQQSQNCSTSSVQPSLGKSDAAHRVQTEALKSPLGAVRTPRQKTPLVQRWEAGMVNGHREEEED